MLEVFLIRIRHIFYLFLNNNDQITEKFAITREFFSHLYWLITLKRDAMQ